MDNGGGVVLLVEDNKELNAVNSRALKLRGYTILAAATLREARQMLAGREPDVILLDVMLPDGDGLDFCAEIRPNTTAHILFLTAKTEQADRVRGLTGGGDDYITKPFYPEELMARVGAAMRRRAIGAANVIAKGALTLDTVSARAAIRGADLMLTPKEFALLLLLARREGDVLGVGELYEKVWGQPLLGDRNAIQAVLSKLRKKINKSGYAISTRRGEGYCFERI